jgi:transposase-like protein
MELVTSILPVGGERGLHAYICPKCDRTSTVDIEAPLTTPKDDETPMR